MGVYLMVYYTGDTHGDFKKIVKFVRDNKLTAQDVVVILGDAGFNYFLDIRDEYNKEYVNNLGISIFCVHGNHEARPQTIPSYKQTTWNGGKVYKEWKYPNLLFAIDGEVYNLDGKNSLVIGGAYSVDKAWRLRRAGLTEENNDPRKSGWFNNEQLTEKEMSKATKQLNKFKRTGKTIDFIFSHTCPYSWEPCDLFLGFIDQSTVDNSMEIWMDSLKTNIPWKYWCFGHFHVRNKTCIVCQLFQSFLFYKT